MASDQPERSQTQLVRDPEFCEQCGRSIARNRQGGARKRFCGAACRSAHYRRCPSISSGATVATRISAQERLAALEDLYIALKADIEHHGTLVPGQAGVRANPSIALFLRVNADLGRYAPPANEVEREQFLEAV